jgi:hypothetical protein
MHFVQKKKYIHWSIKKIQDLWDDVDFWIRRLELMTSAATRTTIRLPLRHAGFVRMLTLGLFDSRTICPDSQIWLFQVSHFDRFLSGLYPAVRPKIHNFCPDRDKAFSAIARVLPLYIRIKDESYKWNS